MTLNPFKLLGALAVRLLAGSARQQNRRILEVYPDTLDMKLDDRSLKTLDTLNPRAKGQFVAFTLAAKRVAAKFDCDYIAITGTRSWDEQAKLWAKGRTTPGPKVTNAKPGSSWHNFGLAVDYGVFRDGKYLDNSMPELARQVHLAAGKEAARFELEWGGSWKSFVDLPHYQFVPRGMTLAKARELKLQGKPVL
jgi:peptidoglycan L-alanyl-D-glutamate endopeptidase CwlK